MDGFVGGHFVDGGFTAPILRGSVFIDFGSISLSGPFNGVESVQGCEVGEIDGIVAVDGDIRGSDASMGEFIIVEVSQSRGDTMCPAQEGFPSLLLFEVLEEFWLLSEELP